ncbi:MAG TPA: methyltransferase domain-containing protein [Arenimonas sp.]|nr:methyltransferase domain-containing protein [Arenimonas sp.]HOZ06148.1 methyltransferase domain-containing protein [Arenimonas sp.]HPO25507.1 methyltransferase domain-containing protein [Arenimonas sp.]HPW32240.1 methyltransferase domain-containing protein [Arenimonas sp.]
MMDPKRPGEKTDQNWTFFRQWLKNPMGVAAISPSSPQLARQMMAELSDDTQRVIELGGGTGVFTQALLEFGIKPVDLLVLELNEELHQHLQKRFPEAHVVCGDAREIFNLAKPLGFAEKKSDAIVSGLGFLSMPRQSQLDIVSAAFDCLKSDGRFVQFTYGPANPIAREVLETLGLSSRRASFTWWNVPPATVYVYNRRVSRAIPARPMR